MNKKTLFLSFLFLFATGVVAQEAAYKAGKLSPATATFLNGLQQTASDLQARESLLKFHSIPLEQEVMRVNAFVTLEEGYEPEVLVDSFGLELQVYLPSIQVFTASVPVDQIEPLALHPAVRQVEMGMPMVSLLDEARAAGNVDQVHAGTDLPSSYTGKDVIVGVIDGGFQYDHAAFYSMDGGTLRVKRAWDILKEDYNRTENEYTTEEEIVAAKYDYFADYYETHATHVAGIAAGADTASGYYGVAPDADLVLVTYSVDDASVLNGIKYVYDYADEVGKPAVVNMSLGTIVGGGHDGMSTFDRAVDEMQGAGRLFVTAAGNYGEGNTHISKTFSSDDDVLATFTGTAGSSAAVHFYGEVDKSFSVQLVLYDVTTNEDAATTVVIPADTTAFWNASLSAYFGGNSIAYLTTGLDSYNQKPNVYMEVYLAGTSSRYKLGLRFRGEENSTVHGWALETTFSGEGIDGWTDGDTDYTIMDKGASGNRAITVGAYTTKNEGFNMSGAQLYSGYTLGDIAPFSSLGPTTDGRMKPDITAPGSFLVSAFTEKSYSYYYYQSYVVAKNDASDYYGIMQGTSMAAPYVTGVLATWLQAKPDLTPEEVREVLKETAITDSYTGDITGVGNNTWGYGKIDAAAGLKKVIELAQASKDPITTQKEMLDVTGGNERLSLYFYTDRVTQATARLYTISGQLAGSYSISLDGYSQRADLDVSTLPSGIYVLRVDADGLMFAPKKVAVNLR